MNATDTAAAPVLSFFLGSGAAARYCLYYPPAGRCRGAYQYVAPFAEEMNKARRMAALQARRMAGRGYAVLCMDLHGCGDSAGDFAQARWDGWLDDLARGAQWLHQRLGEALPQAPGLWGLRLGALLALDYAQRGGTTPADLLLWQPSLNGSAALTQFLRLKVAGDMLSGEGAQGGGTNALRAAFARGEALEIAGYTVAPALALAIDALDAARLPAPACPVRWFELASKEDQPLTPAASRMLAAWQAAGATATAQSVAGPQFWATQEISTSPALLDATDAVPLDACHAA
ncbi:hydrolase 2, exosortase A system-associated [Rugamonas sp.]|uniref:hydrolase 2, exosortase A system-associated n=1 Tax=Rugamonas sp. TaxID=1926287 RepID=UPI0025D7B393|nr:hydrolase 2, exosortase A system-associated [Rugamonas sp.]